MRYLCNAQHNIVVTKYNNEIHNITEISYFTYKCIVLHKCVNYLRSNEYYIILLPQK